jgi:hypothetical protein
MRGQRLVYHCDRARHEWSPQSRIKGLSDGGQADRFWRLGAAAAERENDLVLPVGGRV